jgi:hypothetical protein
VPPLCGERNILFRFPISPNDALPPIV